MRLSIRYIYFWSSSCWKTVQNIIHIDIFTQFHYYYDFFYFNTLNIFLLLLFHNNRCCCCYCYYSAFMGTRSLQQASGTSTCTYTVQFYHCVLAQLQAKIQCVEVQVVWCSLEFTNGKQRFIKCWYRELLITSMQATKPWLENC